MKRFRKNRNFIEFEYEFEDGEVAKFKYLEPTTKMIDEGIDKKETKEQLDYIKNTLQECLVGDSEKKERMIEELYEDGNLYDFKGELDEAVGKLKKKR